MEHTYFSKPKRMLGFALAVTVASGWTWQASAATYYTPTIEATFAETVSVDLGRVSGFGTDSKYKDTTFQKTLNIEAFDTSLGTLTGAALVYTPTRLYTRTSFSEIKCEDKGQVITIHPDCANIEFRTAYGAPDDVSRISLSTNSQVLHAQTAIWDDEDRLGLNLPTFYVDTNVFELVDIEFRTFLGIIPYPIRISGDIFDFEFAGDLDWDFFTGQFQHDINPSTTSLQRLNLDFEERKLWYWALAQGIFGDVYGRVDYSDLSQFQGSGTTTLDFEMFFDDVGGWLDCDPSVVSSLIKCNATASTEASFRYDMFMEYQYTPFEQEDPTGDDTPTVPLPASGLLLLASLGAIAAKRRK